MTSSAEGQSITNSLSDHETTAEDSGNVNDNEQPQKEASSGFFQKARDYITKLQDKVDENIPDEIEPLSKVIIPPVTCMFLRIQRGDFPLSPIRFSRPNACHTHYNEWFKKIVLHNTKNREICKKAGILRAMHCSSLLRVHRNDRNLQSLLPRWNSKQHSFVTAWGSMTPTLLDVNEILGLSILGTRVFDETSLSIEESNIVDDLIRAFDNPDALDNEHKMKLKASLDEPFTPATKKNVKATWINYWLGEFDEVKKKYVGGIAGPENQLAALITLWLSEYVFHGPPSAGLAKRLFSVAACLATGSRLPLASMFLGSLYKRLDELNFFMEQSKGEYCVVSHIDVPFICIWLYEHVPECAPPPNHLNPTLLSHPLKHRHRAERWIDTAAAEPHLWTDFIDDINKISFRPYGKHREYTFPNIVISFTEKNYSMLDRDHVDETAATFAAIIEPHWLQSIIEQEGFSSKNRIIDVEYYPSDVSSFLGLPQKVPSAFLSPKPSETKVAHLYCEGHYTAFGHLHSVTLPAFRNEFEPLFTKSYAMYLRQQLSTWEEFAQTKAVHPVTCDINRKSMYLGQLSGKQSKGSRKKPKKTTPPFEADTSALKKKVIDMFEHPAPQTTLQVPHLQPQPAFNYPCNDFGIIDRDIDLWSSQLSTTQDFSIGTLNEYPYANITDTFGNSTTVYPLQQFMDTSQGLYYSEAAGPSMAPINDLAMPTSSSAYQETAATSGYNTSYEQSENNTSTPTTAEEIMNSILEREPNLFQTTTSPDAVLFGKSLLPTIVVALKHKTGASLCEEDINFLTTSLAKLRSVNIVSHVINRYVDEALLLYGDKTYGPQAVHHLQESQLLTKKIQQEEADLTQLEEAIKTKTEAIAQMRKTVSEKKTEAAKIFQELQSARARLGYNPNMELDQQCLIKSPF